MQRQSAATAPHEQILERVCAIDVAKASGMVCTRVQHPSRLGKRRTRVWDNKDFKVIGAEWGAPVMAG